MHPLMCAREYLELFYRTRLSLMYDVVRIPEVNIHKNIRTVNKTIIRRRD